MKTLILNKMIHFSPRSKNIYFSACVALFVALSFSGFSQEVDKYCGTTIDASNIERLQEFNEHWINRSEAPAEVKAYGGSTIYVPVQLHLINDDNGLGGISEAEALLALDRMNDFYIDASIHFYQCGGIDIINNSTYFDYNKTQMADLDAAYSQDNVVNIYVANSATSGSSSICGHAQFPGGLDFIMQATSCMNNGSTLAHEMGHYLGLYHTHSTTFGDEAVDGSDCATQGDLICDTPADPNLSGEIDNDGCIYEGTDTDENGQAYLPQVTNILSYASKECRIDITEGQLEKALWTLQNERAYLLCAIPPLDAEFYVRADETCLINKEFRFYNVSEGGISSYSWDFGDGSGTSTAESPEYTYWVDGIYNVTLTVSDGISSDTYSKKVVVGGISIPYLNDFEAGADALDQFEVYESMKNEMTVDPSAAESGSFGLLIDGTEQSSTSPSFQTPNTTEAFQDLWNPYFKTSFSMCVDATYTTDLQLEFDKMQLRTSNDNYTNLVVLINGQQEGSVIQVESTGDDDTGFTTLTYDLSAYDGTVFTIEFAGSHKYDKDRNGTGNGSATFIDNISVTGLVSTDEIDIDEAIQVYPNPAENLISFQLMQNDLGAYSIVDLLGKEVNDLTSVQSTNGNLVHLNISALSSGTYYLGTAKGMAKFYKK
ncbi:MAG: PKD domain-containing protein [Crocinitomicaceae bacterium]|nr:PKD domain-containing protein [Crocinitomicaceae bacterium]